MADHLPARREPPGTRLEIGARLRKSPKSFSFRADDHALRARPVRSDRRRRAGAAGLLTAWWLVPVALFVLLVMTGTWWAGTLLVAGLIAAVAGTSAVRRSHRPWLAQGQDGFTKVAGVQAWDFALRGGPWRAERVAELRALVGNQAPLWWTRPGRSALGEVTVAPGLSSPSGPEGDVRRLGERATAVGTVLWRAEGSPATTTAAGIPALVLVLDAVDSYGPPPAIASASEATQAAEELVRLDETTVADLTRYRRRIVTKVNRALDDTLAYQRALLAERGDSLTELEQGPRAQVDRLLGLDD